jgi:hypothetical protein
MSEQNFKIEQAVRQGGFLSADLYKLYINPLLNFLGESGLGGKIGNINVCAPTCADDVAFIVYNLLDIQTMVDIAVDFSKREGYQLQPATSVILPVKSKIKTIETNEGFWKIDNNKIMPVVDKATHIGITRSDTNSARTTIDENIRKARRATYSLMGTGLHGENGLDPVTSISLLKTYILPILTYGLEIVIPKGKILDDTKLLQEILKQVLSLTVNVADPAVYMISGLLPLEAGIHIKVFTMFGNITRAHKNFTEWKLAERYQQNSNQV